MPNSDSYFFNTYLGVSTCIGTYARTHTLQVEMSKLIACMYYMCVRVLPCTCAERFAYMPTIHTLLGLCAIVHACDHIAAGFSLIMKLGTSQTLLAERSKYKSTACHEGFSCAWRILQAILVQQLTSFKLLCDLNKIW